MKRRVFDPLVWGTVDASKTHGDEVEYFVAIGKEHWGKRETIVLKIQMSYGGKRSGRKAPSFPIDSDDWNRVINMMQKVKDEYAAGKRGAV